MHIIMYNDVCIEDGTDERVEPDGLMSLSDLRIQTKDKFHMTV